MFLNLCTMNTVFSNLLVITKNHNRKEFAWRETHKCFISFIDESVMEYSETFISPHTDKLGHC